MSSWLPRILTHIDQDPRSRTYGCADRNYWHYRTTDFSSLVLQQAAETIALAGLSQANSPNGARLIAISRSAVSFWARCQIDLRGTPEYYRGERSLPALAFSTISIARSVEMLGLQDDRIHLALKHASSRLFAWTESSASNQQVAAIAALCRIRRLHQDLVSADRLQQKWYEVEQLMNPEGWWTEHGGFDSGYQSVTVEALIDIQDSSVDVDALLALEKSGLFLARAITAFGGPLGRGNSRKTVYINPYGVERLATHGAPDRGHVCQMSHVRDLLFRQKPDHVFYTLFAGVDDRYLLHYQGTSVFRAAAFFESNDITENACLTAISRESFAFDEAKLQVLDVPSELVPRPGGQVVRILLSGVRGPVVSIFTTDASGCKRSEVVNSGIAVVGRRRRIYSSELACKFSSLDMEWGFECTYRVGRVQRTPSTTALLLFIRIGSVFMPRGLFALLRNATIVNRATRRIQVHRTVRLIESEIVIEDRIRGLRVGEHAWTRRALSFLHVASAETSHNGNLIDQDFETSAWRHQSQNELVLETRYRLDLAND